MPIDDLEARARFWGGMKPENFSGASLAFPFSGHENLFEGKNVLEIGPGEGRQFKKLSELAARYSVADISREVLDKEIYDEVPRYLITSYEAKLPKGKFDVVHFWYVIHHVKPSELEQFVRFVSNHVKVGGHVLFNTLSLEHMQAQELGGDGKMTSPHPPEKVVEAFEKHFKITHKEFLSRDCILIVATKEK
jgi:2-polyprenyl-3-methyl-5-hydroxy-6-metoxy-1,4-benzoquinol methylase